MPAATLDAFVIKSPSKKTAKPEEEGEKAVIGETMLKGAIKRRLSASPAPVEKRRRLSAATLPNIFTKPLSNEGTPSEADLLALESAQLGPTWFQELQGELRKPYFLSLKKSLWEEGVRHSSAPLLPKKVEVFPAAKDIYSWSTHTPLDKVKVVILGQDPYHNVGQAHGLAFSVQPGVAIPPSLKNIYKEIKNDYPSFVAPKHGYLGSWADQGVLCLNTALTVRAHQANSHAKLGWQEFTDAVIYAVDKHGGQGLGSDDKGGVVVLAWGAPAAKRIAKLDKKKHLILTSVHPSPLSASRGFFGNQHFKKANDWLRERYGGSAVIDWTRLDLPVKGQDL